MDPDGGDCGSTGSGHVHVCAAFNVRHRALPDFYEAAGRLLSQARSDRGCVSFDLQREQGWARQVSNQDRSLFMVLQEWNSAIDIEAHVRSAHATQFDGALMDNSMLACAPSLSLFGTPLGVEDLKKMAREARAAGGQENVEPVDSRTNEAESTRGNGYPAAEAPPGALPSSRTSGRGPGGYARSSSSSRPDSGSRSRTESGPAKARSQSINRGASWR
mmetsp:Transcript_52947/g.85715  ORF Transcript_52947/g.85715 Transcript_52947/m.85715 type:complete len:218 (-) Transcript_52947:33-686(-)